MWSTLWPFLLTALLTLAVTLVIQFYAVPRVETRKRQEDRWERDLLALGELLTFEQPAAANDFFHSLWIRSWLHSIREDAGGNSDRIAALLAEGEEPLRKERAEYQRLDTRVDWFADRVCAIDNYAEKLRPFVVARSKYTMAQARGSLIAAGSVEQAPAPDELLTIRESERVAVAGMVKAIKGLIGHPPPRTALSKRIGQRLRQWLAPVLRRHVALQIRRENNAHGQAD